MPKISLRYGQARVRQFSRSDPTGHTPVEMYHRPLAPKSAIQMLAPGERENKLYQIDDQGRIDVDNAFHLTQLYVNGWPIQHGEVDDAQLNWIDDSAQRVAEQELSRLSRPILEAIAFNLGVTLELGEVTIGQLIESLATKIDNPWAMFNLKPTRRCYFTLNAVPKGLVFPNATQFQCPWIGSLSGAKRKEIEGLTGGLTYKHFVEYDLDRQGALNG